MKHTNDYVTFPFYTGKEKARFNFIFHVFYDY